MFGENLQHQSSVQFWCGQGFTLRGSSVIQCIDGRWDSPTPVCEGNITLEYSVSEGCEETKRSDRVKKL